MIREINLNNYKVKVENFYQWEVSFRRTLQQALKSAELRLIDIYNMGDTRKDFNAGNENRFVIFLNATTKNNEQNESMILDAGGVEINGKKYELERLLPYEPPQRDTIIITSEDGYALAMYEKERNQLYVLFDLVKEFSEDRVFVLQYILQQLEEKVFLPKTYEHSWIHTGDREALIKRTVDSMKREKERELRRSKDELRDIEARVSELRRSLKMSIDRQAVLQKQVEASNDHVEGLTKRAIDEFELIAKFDKVKDLQIKDGIITIFTTPIYAYDLEGRRFYIGNMRIEINPDNSDVKFYGDNERRSYWSDEDPHPHVNGDSGEACLGNIAPTIAELCSQMQLYALATVCIDFLENVNTDDIAGKNVIHWDEVDEDGDIIMLAEDREEDEIEEFDYICERCDEGTNELHEVYDNLDEYGEPEDQLEVCEDCRDSNYTHNNRVHAYVHDDVDVDEILDELEEDAV